MYQAGEYPFSYLYDRPRWQNPSDSPAGGIVVSWNRAMKRAFVSGLAGAIAMCIGPLASAQTEEPTIADKSDAIESEAPLHPSGELVESPEEAGTPTAEPEMRVSSPSESGYFVFEGRYVSPPYVLQQRGEDLFVNGCLVPAEQTSRPSFPFGMGPGGWRRYGGGAVASRFSRMEQQFVSGALLFVQEDGTNGFIVPQNALSVLRVLVSDAPQNEKIQLLSDGRFPRFNSAEWAGIVESFEPASDLVEQIAQIDAENERLLEEAHAAHRRVQFLDSGPMRYGVTVAAMVLVVIALGNLLNHRPKHDGRWTDINQDADRMAMVMRNVILLVLLNGFDLGLSLVAQQAGSFLELNPLGTKLIENPAYLAAFKLTALLTSCLILLSLRRYHGAQTASWWLCLVCTILTFRWLTYNSMFLA